MVGLEAQNYLLCYLFSLILLLTITKNRKNILLTLTITKSRKDLLVNIFLRIIKS